MIHKEISFGYDYDVDNNILLAKDIISNYGLFSTFTLMLSSITQVHSKYNITPVDIVTSNVLKKFNDGESFDLYKTLFKIDNTVELQDVFAIGPNDHHTKYSNDKIKKLQPYFKKYFSLNDDIVGVKNNLISKYGLGNDRLSVIYRSSDKWTDLGGFNFVSPSAYMKLSDDIIRNNPNLEVIIQSEDMRVVSEFHHRFRSKFIKETSIGELNYNEAPIPKKDKLIWLKNYVASIYIHGESKYLITYTGNSGYFSVLHRGNTDNLYQEITYTLPFSGFFLKNNE